MLNFSKILSLRLFSKFLNVCLELNDHYWPTKLSSLADGLLSKTPEIKIDFERFYCEIWELCEI